MGADVVTLLTEAIKPADMLETDDLRDVDKEILEYMVEGRVTPVYCKKRLEESGQKYSRGYVQERLSRFVEHEHAENLLETGLYELVNDPREYE
ncbi:hypothetical protein [Halorussus litoreus]|uniref:hypothetical protein n=1 Tax=Halorussus litoreus TaxID=1710536 RepID=UPI001E439D63|nr:hypothetical protein [Halorussus litoreus]